MAIKQISVFVENKKGALEAVLKVFSDNGVGLRAMTIADTKDYGILRVIVDDQAAAVEALNKAEVLHSVNDVVAVEAADVNQLPPRVEAREESADDDEDEEDREDDAEEPVDAE